MTQPIKYARHKNHKRVWLTIGLVWAISAAIGLPIVLGLNYSERRISTDCAFYNADFVIYSSLSSFYIPCIIMVFLYYQIFKVNTNSIPGLLWGAPSPTYFLPLTNTRGTSSTRLSDCNRRERERDLVIRCAFVRRTASAWQPAVTFERGVQCEQKTPGGRSAFPSSRCCAFYSR